MSKRKGKKKSVVATLIPLIIIMLAICGAGGYLFFFNKTPDYNPETDTNESISVQVKPGQGQEDNLKKSEKRKKTKSENKSEDNVNVEVYRDEDGELVYHIYSAKDYIYVYFIDVGQADSILIKYEDNTPQDGDDSEAMLIDAGEETSGTFIRKILKEKDVSSLKYFVCTHPDADHIGGAASIVSNIPIETEMVFAPDYKKDTLTYEKLINEINFKSYKYCPPKTGDMYLLGKAELRFYVPQEPFSDPNNNSIVCKLTYGEGSILFTGDCSMEEEELMLEECPFDLKSDILKVGHHGSDSSSTSPFIDAVRPKYAVISCGKDNTYGHPHKSVLERLENIGAEICRTDINGTILLRMDGTNDYKWRYPCD